MLNRITIMIDSELQKLREKQARMIKQESKGVSFSSVINETLEDCLKKKNNPAHFLNELNVDYS